MPAERDRALSRAAQGDARLDGDGVGLRAR